MSISVQKGYSPQKMNKGPGKKSPASAVKSELLRPNENRFKPVKESSWRTRKNAGGSRQDA